MKKRMISLFLAFVMIFSVLPVTANAQGAEKCTLTVGTVSGLPGSVVEVDVSIKNNPGIIGASFILYWDGGLILTDCANGEAWSELTFTPPGNKVSGGNFVWYANEIKEIKDGTVLKLFFKIPESAMENDRFTLTMECLEENMYDRNLQTVPCDVVNGSICVFSYQLGDLTNDGAVKTNDLIQLSRFIADKCFADPDGYNVQLNRNAANVNDDGKINPLDLIFLSRYVADGSRTNPDGYNIRLLYPVSFCTHQMKEIPYKAATCTEDGNATYWECTLCGKHYNDAGGSKELTPEQTVLKALGHDVVVIPGKDPTYTEPGYTESKKCARCGEILKAREEIPVLKPDEYTITYHISDNDMYLQSIDADAKNPNPAVYTPQAGLILKSISIPGYNFLGWYDGAGDDAVGVQEIPAGSKGNQELYAHWEKVKYTVEFDSPDIPAKNVIFTVDKGVYLPKPQHFGYTFVGWSVDGNIVSEIKPGYLPKNSNKVVVHANWTSNRNQTRPVSHLDAPSIIEDVENGRYLFLYKIGTVENVPLNSDPTYNFGYMENLSVHKGTEINTSIQTSMVETAAKTVSNATTRSSAWTLSEEWDEKTSASSEHAAEVGKSDAHTNSDGTVTNRKWYVGNNQSGTTLVSTNVGGSSYISAKVTNQESTGLNSTYEHQRGEQSEQDRKHSVDVGAHAKAKKWGVKFDAGVDYNYTNAKHNESYDDESLKVSTSRNTNEEFVGSSSNSTNWNTNQSFNSSWNSSNGYEAGYQTSHNEAVSKAISEKIYNKDHISSMNARKEGNSSTSSTSDQSKLENEYTSAIEHSTEEGKKISLSQDMTSPCTGYYRLVTAGTIHVYAVVGYDIATNSYFTYTYNVLDANERHPYLDYSMSNSNFNDCENGVLPFEVPYEVQEFIGDKLARSEGLDISLTTGKVNSYTGSEEYVVLPEYMSVDNHNGTYSAVKVTGIEPGVFKGNKNLRGVYFPKYVSYIPNGAFEGCTAMDTLVGNGLITIGQNAFKGCNAMSGFVVDNLISTLGSGAFAGVDDVQITAADAAVADAALSSGAKSLTLDLQKMSDPFNDRKIVIPEQTDIFKLWDNGSTRENLQIESHANTTVLNNLNLAKNNNIPLKIYSPNLTLNRTNVTAAPGLAMALSADQTNIKLFGDNTLSSEGGDTLLAKKLALSREDSGVVGKLNVTGTALLCDANITNPSMFSGTIKQISAEEFDSYLNSHKLIFNANGGEVSPDHKVVNYGTPCGELPVPTRTGHVFAGWYTEADGGTKYDASTTFNAFTDVTLYAHWTVNAYTASWTDGTGYSIRVDRTSSPYQHAATGALSSSEAVYNGDVLSIKYVADEGYAISDHGITSVTVTRSLTSSDIYARAKVNSYRVSWSENAGCDITVTRTSSPKQGASNGNLSNGSAVYYGDTLEITYTPEAGYVLDSKGLTSATVTGNLTSSQIYARTSDKEYYVNWNTGVHCSITVKRTSSPRGAGTGTLSRGSTIYYGDVLKVDYLADTGYRLTDYGKEQITVTDNVTGSSIYASATARDYTYQIRCRSVNGTDLGTSQVTHTYGGTYTVDAPSKSGYHTPAAQRVSWDSTGSKEIVFTYEPVAVSNPAISGEVSNYETSHHEVPTITYVADFECRNRTANSMEIRVTISETIKERHFSDYIQRMSTAVGGSELFDLKVVDLQEWSGQVSYKRTAKATSAWVRVPVNTTDATTLTLDTTFYHTTWDGTVIRGTYSITNAKWKLNIPAY